jgi:hypothetical protein
MSGPRGECGQKALQMFERGVVLRLLSYDEIRLGCTCSFSSTGLELYASLLCFDYNCEVPTALLRTFTTRSTRPTSI